MNKIDGDGAAFGHKFSSEISESFFFQIQRMRKAIFRRSNFLMNEAGISLQQEQLPLLIILLKGNRSQRELSDITLRDKSSILRSINALKRRTLVKVWQDDIDKRKNVVSLTPEGFDLANHIKSLMREAEEEVLSVFSQKERFEAFQAVKGYADRLEKL
jgi:DNA-binding MarR family transcriptional regulator